MAAKKTPPQCEPVDLAIIAERSGYSVHYVRNWARGLVPAGSPAFPLAQPYRLNGGRWWQWAEVSAWLHTAGLDKRA